MKNKFVSAQWMLPVLILFLALALRLYHLGDKGLWGDEIAQARWALFPLDKMWERFRDPPDFILHFLFGQFALQFGSDAFWIRLPSLLTSLLAVPATYIAARRVGSLPVALAAMLLMALSPFQIWYAQEARMYASLVCFATLSLYFFLRLLDKPQWRAVLGLGLANAAAVYTHLFGVMPAVIESAALCGLAGIGWWRGRNTKNAIPLWKRIPRSYWLIAASLALAGILALPLVPGTLPYVAHPSSNGIEAAYGDESFHLSPQFLQLLLGDMSLAPDLGWRTSLSLGLALAGFVLLARKNGRGAWIFGVWLLFPLLLLQLTHPSHTVADRYLIFLQPVYLILISFSLYAITRGANRLLLRAAWWRARTASTRFTLGAGVVALLLCLFSVAPLSALYARAKLNDWQTLARFFETHTTPGDVLMVEKGFWGMNTLAYYLKNVDAFSSPPATMEELNLALTQNRTMWYMSFGGYLNPQQEAWVKENLRRVDGAEWMRSDLDYVPRDEFSFTQSEPLLEIYTRQGKIPSEIRYDNELGDRARATPHLPVKPGDRLEAELAAQGPAAHALVVEYKSQQPERMTVAINGESADGSRTLRQNGEIIVEYDLPPNSNDAILVQIKNDAAKPLYIQRIALEPRQ